MSGYGRFALYYDLFTMDVGYKRRAAFFDSLIKAYVPEARLLLDLACGTGSLSLEFSALGYDVVGVDASEDMLGMAEQKRGMFKGPVMFLCQMAEELDLFGTVGACVCALDSLNHLPDEASLEKAVGRVSLFLDQGGIFIFDLNTLYKHKTILSCNNFVYESGDVFCVWRNSFREADGSVDIELDFFEKAGDKGYKRYSESFTERYFSDDRVKILLERSGLALYDVFDGDSFRKPGERSQRLLYLAGKK